MSSELHELIEKELQAADVRLEAGTRLQSAGTQRTQHPQHHDLPRSPSAAAKDYALRGLDTFSVWAHDAHVWVKASYATYPFRWKVGGTVTFVVLVLIIALSSGGSGGMVMAGTPGKSHNHPSDVETPQLHYVRTRQGMDPEAVPSVVIAGVHKGGATDLYRRLLARFPALQPGEYRELNFLTQCQSDTTELLAYRTAHKHCDAPLNNGSADPRCHGCTPLGYATLFNTTGVRHRLGKCSYPLTTQSMCAGGAVFPDADAVKTAMEGYSPVFTVDASVKAYASSVGSAYRAASTLSKVSPRTKVILLLRSPADVPRAVYNAKLEAECGTHECQGDAKGNGSVPPYETLIARELAFLNSSTSGGKTRLAALVNASDAKVAKQVEEEMLLDWTKYAKAHGFEPTLWGHAMWSLHGLYAPLVQAWTDRFVTAGRPMLVLQSEAYFQDPGAAVDSVLGPFLFGDADAAAVFRDPAGAGPGEAAPLRKYGNKAVQSVGQRCAMYDLLREPTKVLEEQLTQLQKQGKVQLRRARPTGPLWPWPAECGPSEEKSQTAPTESGDYLDYAEGLGGQQDSYAPDYDYAYTFAKSTTSA